MPETESEQTARAEQTRRHTERIAAFKDERSQDADRKSVLDELIEKGKAPSDQEVSLDELTKERDELADRIGQLDREIEHAEFFTPRVPRVYGV